MTRKHLYGIRTFKDSNYSLNHKIDKEELGRSNTDLTTSLHLKGKETASVIRDYPNIYLNPDIFEIHQYHHHQQLDRVWNYLRPLR